MTYLQSRLPVELLQILILIGISYWMHAANRKVKISKAKARNGIIELRVAFFVFLFFAVIFIKNNYDVSPASNQLKTILSGKIASLEINGSQLRNADTVLMALKNMCNLPPHHSHTTDNLQLTINADMGSFQLDLQRDSVYPNEYWVFFRAYSRSVIGYICTNELDKY